MHFSKHDFAAFSVRSRLQSIKLIHKKNGSNDETISMKMHSKQTIKTRQGKLRFEKTETETE